jgi:hypothetical protein
MERLLFLPGHKIKYKQVDPQEFSVVLHQKIISKLYDFQAIQAKEKRKTKSYHSLWNF